jgi:hypothetical protein
MSDSKPDHTPDNNDLSSFVESEVLRAENTFKNFRDRSLTLITTSGALVAIVSGLLAIAVGASKTKVPVDSQCTIAVSLLSFIASAVCSLFINKPVKIRSGDEDQLAGYVQDNWDDEGWGQEVAKLLVVYLTDLRNDNERTAKLLSKSIKSQIGGMTLIAVSVVLILIHAG